MQVSVRDGCSLLEHFTKLMLAGYLVSFNKVNIKAYKSVFTWRCLNCAMYIYFLFKKKIIKYVYIISKNYFVNDIFSIFLILMCKSNSIKVEGLIFVII